MPFFWSTWVKAQIHAEIEVVLLNRQSDMIKCQKLWNIFRQVEYANNYKQCRWCVPMVPMSDADGLTFLRSWLGWLLMMCSIVRHQRHSVDKVSEALLGVDNKSNNQSIPILTNSALQGNKGGSELAKVIITLNRSNKNHFVFQVVLNKCCSTIKN